MTGWTKELGVYGIAFVWLAGVVAFFKLVLAAFDWLAEYTRRREPTDPYITHARTIRHKTLGERVKLERATRIRTTSESYPKQVDDEADDPWSHGA